MRKIKTLCAVALGLAGPILGGYWYTLGMPGRAHTGPLPPMTTNEAAMAQTLRRHVVAIASQPHNTSHPENLETSAHAIESVLTAQGYKPKAQVYKSAGIDVRNIEVVIEPTEKTGIETLVVGAHYDSAYTAPGANDNGSGTAALLEIARIVRDHRPKTTRLRLVFFVNEEPPHFQTDSMGSLVYARALKASGETVRGMMSLETLGAYFETPGTQMYPPPFSFILPSTGNFVAIVGSLGSRPFVSDVTRLFRDGTAFPTLAGVAPAEMQGMMWSDHWSFSQVGIPAVMLTDTAPFRYPHYHKPSDTPDKLDYDKLARVTTGIARVVQQLAR